jgi:hypothetical protein
VGTIRITGTGEVRYIHSDSVHAALKPHLSNNQPRRASHVEPTGPAGTWIADMSPMGGPSLGPFENRSDALVVEVDWLRTYAQF